MRYLTKLRSNISDFCSHKYKKIKINLGDHLPYKNVKFANHSDNY